MENKNLTSKTLRYGGYSVAVTAIVLVAVILLNLAMQLLPATYTKLATDGDGLYTISSTSRMILETVTDKIKVYIVCYEDAMDSVVKEYVARYIDLNRNLSYETVDPTLRPGFVAEYTDETLYADETNLIVVNETNGRSRVIPYSEIYYTQYTESDLYYFYMYYGYYPENPTYFNVEGELTSALDYVTMEHLPVLYYTSGHGEVTLDATMQALIKEDNIDLKELAAGAKEIPADASAILIATPSKDFTADEVALLRDYADKGGKILLTSYYNNSLKDRKLTNLYGLAAEYGLLYEDVLVFEGSSDHYYSYYGPYYILPNLTAGSYADAVPNNTKLLMGFCHAIGKPETLPEGVSVTNLMTTTLKGYAKTKVDSDTTMEKEEGDREGQFVIGAMAAKTTGKAPSTFVWLASPLILDGSTVGSFSNASYAMAVITDLCDKEASVTVDAKALQVEALSVSEGASGMWGLLLIGALPLVTLAIGFVTWYRRARR